MKSLNSRLLLVASVILILFFGITGLTLDRIYRENAEEAQYNRLQGYLYDLIIVTEFSHTGIIRPPVDKTLPDIRFSIQDSGLYAQITQNQGHIIWRSESVHSKDIPIKYGLKRGEQRYGTLENSHGEKFYYYSFGISWDETTSLPQSFTYTIAETSKRLNHTVAAFRQNLWGSLGAVAILLLAVQGMILRWGLSPLRQVTEDLKTLESGTKVSLDGNYPLEIRRLTDDLNALLHSHQENLKRYRQTMGDLAHSLKTPLSVLRSAADANKSSEEIRETLNNQVERMSQIIEYQLHRAVSASRSAFASPVTLGPLVGKISTSLMKVYADKKIAYRSAIPDKTLFYGDEGDLMEIIGNTLDNAFKWCRHEVTISIENNHAQTTRPGLVIMVEDDGPGIDESQILSVLQRGIRADETVSGHGIGLAVVQDITASHGGTLRIERSRLGGACIRIVLPGN